MAKNWINAIEIGTNCFGEGYIKFNRWRDNPKDPTTSLHCANRKYPIQTALRSQRVTAIATALHQRCEARQPKTSFPYATTYTYIPSGNIRSQCGERIMMLHTTFRLRPTMCRDTLLVSGE